MSLSLLVRSLCLAFSFIVFLSGPAHAQSATATLSGVVLDDTSAAVPDVSIVVRHLATGLQRETASSAQGTFVLPLLPPGRYNLVAQRQGFTPARVESVTLNVNDELMLKLQLKVAGVGEAVSVAAEPSRVSTSTAVSTTIDRQFVENLPLNGRSFQSLILLTPGVTVMDGQGQFSVNGQRTNTNYFTVDGVAANVGVNFGLKSDVGINGEYAALSIAGLTSSLVSVDALEEFKLQSSTYAAEFGRQQGGQVQLVTRSGTNEIHGSAYEYVRNEALDANDWFANQAGLEKAPLRQHQPGGTLGGPVSRDRTFFFFSHESLRLRVPATEVTIVPSLRLREVAAPAVRPFLDAFPLPDGPEHIGTDGAPLGVAPLTVAYSQPSVSDATSLRLDHVVNSRLALNGRYNRAPSNSRTRDGAVVTTNEINTEGLTVAATMMWSPRVSHETRFNYTRGDGVSASDLDDFGGAVPIDWSRLVTYSGTGRRRGQFYFYPLAGDDTRLDLGDERSTFQQQINLVSSLSLVAGSHQLKVGLDYRRLMPTFAPIDHFQQSRFEGEESIRSGIMPFIIVTSRPEIRPRFDNVSLYAQDTWHASPRLTLDVGVRWDVNPAPGDANGREPILIEGVRSAADMPNARLAPPDTPIHRTFWTAIAPRLGAAYQLVRASGREAVLRGGFGLYYDIGTSQDFEPFTRYPFEGSAQMENVPFPVPPELELRPELPRVELPLPGGYMTVVNPDLKLPYTLQWNVAVEQALGRHQALTAGYVGSAGRRLLTNFEVNNATVGPQPNPNFGILGLITNQATSDYHALQLQFQRRLSRGLQALVSYTWSHAIDVISEDVNARAPELIRGNAAFDVRHNVSAAVTFQVPGVRANRALSAMTSGWAIDGIVHAQSGLPVDILDAYVINPDGSYNSARPDRVPGIPLYVDDPGVPGGRRFNAAAIAPVPLGEDGLPTHRGDLGRHVFRGLPLYQVDLAIQRRFRLTPRFSLQLRAEAFNVFNHPNFGNYGANVNNPGTLGVPRTMLNRSLGGLNALYQIGGPRSMQLSMKIQF